MSDITWTNTTVKLGDLQPWERNPKHSTKKQAKRILESWDKYGQVQTAAIGPNNEVYDFHQRLSALLTVHGPDYIVDARQASRELSESEREQLVVTLHAGAVGSWDWAELANWNTDSLQSWGFDQDVLSQWNTDAASLALMLESEKAELVDVEPQIDRAAELQEKWSTSLGQMWILDSGKGHAHRLICGDCTDRAVVERVMDGERVNLLFTSPPYAQQRDYTNDSDVSDWAGLMQGAFGAAICADDCQVLVNLGLIHRDGEWQPYWDGWIEWMRGQGWRRFGWYVWDQGPGLPGDWQGRLAPSHEWVFHFNRKSAKPFKTQESKWGGMIYHGKGGLRGKDGVVSQWTHKDQPVQDTKIADSVCRVSREKSSYRFGHPAMFSIGMAIYFLESWPGTVYDPFSGSGTTLIACEQLGRRCRAVEIAPGYVAVALQRFQDTLGVTPTLLP